MKQLEQVKTFMTTFGQPVLDTPTPLTPDRLELRRRLSQEELDEFVEAGNNKDIVETADALTDRLYVLLGDYLEAGLGDLLEPLFDEVQASNMSKVCSSKHEAIQTKNVREKEQGEPMHIVEVGDYYVVYRTSDGKVMKNVNYFKPDLKSIIDRHLIKQLGQLLGKAMNKNVEMYDTNGNIIE